MSLTGIYIYIYVFCFWWNTFDGITFEQGNVLRCRIFRNHLQDAHTEKRSSSGWGDKKQASAKHSCSLGHGLKLN